MRAPNTEGRPRLLDLYCKAGGAARGYQRAGFEVVGVDIEWQPRYVGDAFIQCDALMFMDRLLNGGAYQSYGNRSWRLCDFDAIHASPPCQRFSAMRTAWNAKPHQDLLTPTLARLEGLGVPWVVENVAGAPMKSAIQLCGTAFGLGVGNAELRRHRLFELGGFYCLAPPCAHGQRPITIGVYGQHGRDRRRLVQTFFSVEDGKVAMGIDWMTGDELSQAIPPEYTEYIGKQLLESMS